MKSPNPFSRSLASFAILCPASSALSAPRDGRQCEPGGDSKGSHGQAGDRAQKHDTHDRLPPLGTPLARGLRDAVAMSSGRSRNTMVKDAQFRCRDTVCHATPRTGTGTVPVFRTGLQGVNRARYPTVRKAHRSVRAQRFRRCGRHTARDHAAPRPSRRRDSCVQANHHLSMIRAESRAQTFPTFGPCASVFDFASIQLAYIGMATPPSSRTMTCISR